MAYTIAQTPVGTVENANLFSYCCLDESIKYNPEMADDPGRMIEDSIACGYSPYFVRFYMQAYALHVEFLVFVNKVIANCKYMNYCIYHENMRIAERNATLKEKGLPLYPLKDYICGNDYYEALANADVAERAIKYVGFVNPDRIPDMSIVHRFELRKHLPDTLNWLIWPEKQSEQIDFFNGLFPGDGVMKFIEFAHAVYPDVADLESSMTWEDVFVQLKPTAEEKARAMETLYLWDVMEILADAYDESAPPMKEVKVDMKAVRA